MTEMLSVLRSENLLWEGEPQWSPREFFTKLTTAIAAVSSYQHDLTFWRGHGDSTWRLSPRLIRDLPQFAVAQDVVNKETEVLLGEAKRARPTWLEGMSLKGSSDLDLLALLQHLGAATPLLDLTTDPFVSLYFAVADDQKPGLLLGIQAGRWRDLTPKPAAYSKQWSDHIRSLEGDERVAYFRPPNISARIPAQRSVLAFGHVPTRDSWADSIGAFPVGEVASSWSDDRADLAFGRTRSRGRPGLPPVLGFLIPRGRKAFVRQLLATNFGLSAVSLFPDPQGFGEWRLGRERMWNRDVSATGAQEVNEFELSDRQKLAAFRAIWGKGWVTPDQYASKYGLSPGQAASDIEALVNARILIERDDGQLVEGSALNDLRARLGIQK
jgi:hypothetical protein